ncbi:MAG: methyltransferase family protein [Streptosporangiaceae bacterium]|jgi:protein-S-isoprenylcysteine O-methyltransferase Ste14
MSRRMRWLLALYPRAWRDRYGREVASLTEELIRSGDRTRLRAGLGLAGAAAAERIRTLSRPATAIAVRARAAQASPLGLVVRNLAFTVVVPGLGGAWEPWWILTHHGRAPAPAAWEAVGVIAAGTALYVWCVWNFAAVGRGTPGPWDAPARVVAAGPYRWVRNPIYLAALLIVLGEAWLFMSPRLLAYAGAMAVFFHLFVTGYEERTLRRRFGSAYLEYRCAVPRWIPRRPAAAGT